jgi:membrane protease YdiL (CAAX protease family)
VLLPVLGLGPVADTVRVVSVVVGLGALAALWRAGWPGLGLRWVALPVGLVAPAVAVVQLARGTGGATWAEVADLCFVVVAAEELVFRGALLAIALRAFRPSSSVWPAAVVSALFALWHVGDALGDTAGSAWWWRVLVIVFTLVGTWVFGMACTWLRYRTRTLAGPAGLHLSTNVFRLA